MPVSLTDHHINLSKMDYLSGAIKAGQTEKIAVTFKAGTYDGGGS